MMTYENHYRQLGITAKQITRRIRRASRKATSGRKAAFARYRASTTGAPPVPDFPAVIDEIGPHKYGVQQRGYSDSDVVYLLRNSCGAVDDYAFDLSPARLLSLTCRVEQNVLIYQAQLEQWHSDIDAHDQESLADCAKEIAMLVQQVK